MGAFLDPKSPKNHHSICCRVVLSLIGSQFDTQTTTVSVALLPAVSPLPKLWFIRALDWSSSMNQPGGPNLMTARERTYEVSQIGPEKP